MNKAFRTCIALLVLTPAVLMAEIIVDGRPAGSIQQDKILKAQEQTVSLVEEQVSELKESNSLLRQDLPQRVRTIQIMHDQVEELKKANQIKQKELDGHKYDHWKNLGWIVLTIVLTIILTKLFDHLVAKHKEKQTYL